jgi:hypothetical protein
MKILDGQSMGRTWNGTLQTNRAGAKRLGEPWIRKSQKDIWQHDVVQVYAQPSCNRQTQTKNGLKHGIWHLNWGVSMLPPSNRDSTTYDYVWGQSKSNVSLDW